MMAKLPTYTECTTTKITPKTANANAKSKSASTNNTSTNIDKEPPNMNDYLVKMIPIPSNLHIHRVHLRKITNPKSPKFGTWQIMKAKEGLAHMNQEQIAKLSALLHEPDIVREAGDFLACLKWKSSEGW